MPILKIVRELFSNSFLAKFKELNANVLAFFAQLIEGNTYKESKKLTKMKGEDKLTENE